MPEQNPLYVTITATEKPGGYDSAVVADASTTPHDRYRMAVQLMVALAERLATDINEHPSVALNALADAAGSAIGEMDRMRAMFEDAGA